MGKIGLFLAGAMFFYSLIFVSISNSKEITVITYEELRCQKIKIVLKHKELAIKLTFSGTPPLIADKKDGFLRCRTTKEVIDMIMEISPEYYLVEYTEYGE